MFTFPIEKEVKGNVEIFCDIEAKLISDRPYLYNDIIRMNFSEKLNIERTLADRHESTQKVTELVSNF